LPLTPLSLARLMNTTPITPFSTPVIRFEVAMPSAARPVNKAAQALVETEARAEVIRAVNAFAYATDEPPESLPGDLGPTRA